MTVEPYRSRPRSAPRADVPGPRGREIARLRLRRAAPLRGPASVCSRRETSPGMFVGALGHAAHSGRDGHGHDLLIAELSAEDSPAKSASSRAGARSRTASRRRGEALLVGPGASCGALLVAEASRARNHAARWIPAPRRPDRDGAGGPVLIGCALVPGHGAAAEFSLPQRHPAPRLRSGERPGRTRLHRALRGEARGYAAGCGPDGSVLRNPGENELADASACWTPPMGSACTTSAVVGAGPAGLATAVYAPPKGSPCSSSTRRLRRHAGASARIGTISASTGISGQALAGRAYTQAQNRRRAC